MASRRGDTDMTVRVGPLPYDSSINSPRDFPTYGLDIETDTSINGLDPEVAPIVAVALTGEGLEEVLDGESVGGESAILRRLDDLISSLSPGALITWNGTRFDLPFIARRAEMLGIELGLRHPRGRATWFRQAHIDGYLLFRADVGDSVHLSCGLKPLAKFVGLPVIEVDRRRIHELSTAECRAYVASDAHLARALVERRWATARLTLGSAEVQQLVRAG